MACNTSTSDDCSNEYMDSSIDCNKICTKSSSCSDTNNICNKSSSDNLVCDLQNICGNVDSSSCEKKVCDSSTSDTECNGIVSCTSSIKLKENDCYDCYENSSNGVYCNNGQSSSCLNDISNPAKAICDLRLDVLQILELVGKMNKELCSQKKTIKALCKNSNSACNQISKIKKCSSDSLSDCTSVINDEFAKLQDDMEKKIDIVKSQLDTKFSNLINNIKTINTVRNIGHKKDGKIVKNNLRKGYLI